MRRPTFRTPVRPAKALPREYNPWWWHPNRAGVRTAPAWFQDSLEKVDDSLAATWNPIRERWQLWERSPRIQNPTCQGWKLLFIHNGPEGEHLPLDERVLARLWHCKVLTHGSAKAYFDRIQAEYQRDREKAEEQHRQDTIDAAMPSFDHSKIQVSGFGKSSGSKFSKYHA